MAKQNKPAIRFKGFTDAWEQRKLGDFCEMFNGDRSAKYPNEQDMVHEGIPFINAGDLENGCVNLLNANKITTEKYNDLGGAKLQLGDIVYCLRGTLGKNAYIDNFSEGTVASSLVAIRPKNIDGKYLFYILNSDIEYSQRILHDEGAAQPNLSAKSVSEFIIPIPNIDEQKKLSSFFDSLSNLITLHQRKYDKLQVLKKAMLEKMFPKNGSSVPEIRFKGFTDAWEQRKFSDITFPAGEKNKENLPLESYSITNESGFVPQDEKFENGGTMREADKRMYYIVSPNSFAYNPARINVGSIGYQDTGKSVIVSSLYEVFKTSDDVDDRLLWHWFKSPDFQKLIMQLQEGGVRLYFYYDKLCMGQVPLPSLEEQRKIGKLFDTLDHLITLHQRELEKLQNIKKSMLEKMFV